MTYVYAPPAVRRVQSVMLTGSCRPSRLCDMLLVHIPKKASAQVKVELSEIWPFCNYNILEIHLAMS